MAGEGNKDNPLTIGDKAIDATFRHLTGNPGEDLIRFQQKLLHVPLVDILHGEFEVFRMGDSGWRIGIDQATQRTFGTTLGEITPLGSEGENYDDESDASWDYMTGTELIRAVIANSFVEQAVIEGKTVPDINNAVIDSPPYERALLSKLSASKPGMTVMVTEDLDAQMQHENGRLYVATMELKDRLTERFTPRTVQLYRDQSEAFLTHHTSQIRENWERSLRKTALRTYGWFTPNQPNLVSVPIHS